MSDVIVARKIERIVFKYGNKFFMVPLLRMGLGRFLGSPPTGYFLLLRTTGHKSGLLRETPLNYAIAGGCVYCLAGFGDSTHWLANLRHNPVVQVRLPDRLVAGYAEEVHDAAEARRRAVQVARNCGFALLFENPRCLVMSDAQLARQLDGRPVVRIRPAGGPLVPGPYDPGGWGWLLPALAQVAVLMVVLAWVRSRRGKSGAPPSQGGKAAHRAATGPARSWGRRRC